MGNLTNKSSAEHKYFTTTEIFVFSSLVILAINYKCVIFLRNERSCAFRL